MFKPVTVALFALLLQCRGFAQETAEIPFRFADGFIQVKVRLPSKSESLNMLLDSGASVSVLDLKAAHRLGLQTGEPLAIRGVTSDAAAFTIHPIPATLGGVDGGRIALAADLATAGRLCAERVDGLIGIDFFRDRIVQIDYVRQRLRLLSHAPVERPDFRLPFKVINDVACVNVGVNGSSRRWVRLDTGCNDALHWVIPKRGRLEKSRGASVGFVTDGQDIASTRVWLGDRVLYSVPTALHGRPFFEGEAGLLGNGLLAQFIVTLDWAAQTLTLQDRAD